MLDELVPQKGEDAAKNEVAQVISKELVARGLIMKSKDLENENVEIKIPQEIIEEARGSSSSQRTAAVSVWTGERSNWEEHIDDHHHRAREYVADDVSSTEE
eukprot:10348053-Karenia_brevis.AAC.1